MPQYRPSSNERPGDQSSLTPSGKKVPMAMSMMVDSMVRMIQKAREDIERADQRAREDVERIDQKARQDLERFRSSTSLDEN